jgi:hypothetical protein
MSATSQVAPTPGTQFESSKRYQVLTERQKAFVLAYLASGDAIEAVLLSFQVKDPNIARVMSYQVLQHPKVADCLAEFQGKTELEIQIEGARRDVLKAPNYAKERARRLLCELTGLLPKNGGKAEPGKDSQPTVECDATIFHVGQLVNERGPDGVLHTGRVLAIDADGTPTKIEEVS